jgi:ribonuclease HI
MILILVIAELNQRYLLDIYIDGASRGNPGLAGIGIVIKKNSLEIAQLKEFVGTQSNNQVEYCALKNALRAALGADPEITIYSDSKLLVTQRNSQSRIRNKKLKILSREISNLERRFNSIRYKYVARNRNLLADRLANEAIDEYIKYLDRYS